MNPNLSFLNTFIDVSEDAFEKLKGISTFKHIKADTLIAKEGETPTKIYMLVSGLMRVYFSTESGKEFNKNFFMPICFVGSFTALIKNKPSKLNYETLTDCKVYEIDYVKLIKLCHTDIVISNLYNKIVEHIFMQYEERQLELISLDAKQRYLELRKRIPDIDLLIAQYHIASYLSITPVQLSRIRKGLKALY
ncbi:cyclic nucleotide-binding protein [Yeosuana aromativorans]|uniref:Cyclic nucleotide-binding protein n=1 Tax=Yeosuana aromativorans TaxID=288019 RepID=A0A8J3BRY0_9FLAO|nr:Crp/Fnr family transcriptional regulator [Yeosuana aromativorans]GGK34544.1 cyclic nucleotide-binding protein [Yeosuana aromativorans]